jgi:hypothetical protein
LAGNVSRTNVNQGIECTFISRSRPYIIRL